LNSQNNKFHFPQFPYQPKRATSVALFKMFQFTLFILILICAEIKRQVQRAERKDTGEQKDCRQNYQDQPQSTADCPGEI